MRSVARPAQTSRQTGIPPRIRIITPTLQPPSMLWGTSECQVLDGRDFVAISAGGSHNVALKTDGTLVAWGDNTCGQCSSTPVGNDFVAISAGDRHNLAMKSDGTLTAWGDNTWGQLNTPAGYNYTAIAAGNYHNLALHSDGWLAAWGKDEYGQCRNTPTGEGGTAWP
ncbi:MAG: RCC1 domain-containing protein [Planctomycetota bacterium]